MTVIPPGRGEVIGDAPDRRVEILCERDALHATWTRFGPRRDGADLHIHRRHVDLFYVLAGELTIRLGPEGDEVVAEAGTLVRLPRLVVHGFRNGSDAEVRYLNLHAPGQRFASYLRSLRDGQPITYDQEDPPADGGRPASEAVIGRGERLAGDPGVDVTVLADEPEIRVQELEGDAETVGAHLGDAQSVYVLDGDGAGSWLEDEPPPHGSGRLRLLAITAPGTG